MIIPDGDDSTTFSLNAAADQIDEPDELLRLGLVNTADYTIDPDLDAADITIVDTDFIVNSSSNTGAGSLRAMLSAAEGAGGGNVIIEVGAGPVQLDTEIEIGDNLTIHGNGETVEVVGSLHRAVLHRRHRFRMRQI